MTLPLILVIDDIYARKADVKRIFLDDAMLAEVQQSSLKEDTHEDLENPVDVIGTAIFCPGQVDKSGYAINDYSLIKAYVEGAWGDNKKNRWSLVLLDLMFDSGKLSKSGIPQGGQEGDKDFGLKVKDQLLIDFPGLPIVMLTSEHKNKINYHYLSKDALTDLRIKLIEHGNISLQQARRLLRLNDEHVFINSIDMIKKVYLPAYQAAKSNTDILLSGETGVGKGIVADYIHRNSDRATMPFVQINCAAIPDNLVESVLFGYEKGSFTGATEQKRGRLEDANRGTFFLDEIGRMSLSTQEKVLTALDSRRIMRIGGTREIELNIRFIAASSKNLSELVESGNFIKDLYYRVNRIPIKIPSLRERKDEILPLSEDLLRSFMLELGKVGIIFSESAKSELLQMDMPGNIRQLRNLIEYLVIHTSSNDVISKDQVASYFALLGVERKSSLDAADDSINRESQGDITAPSDAVESKLYDIINSYKKTGLRGILPKIELATLQVLDEALKRERNENAPAMRLLLGKDKLSDSDKGNRTNETISAYTEISRIAKFCNHISVENVSLKQLFEKVRNRGK